MSNTRRCWVISPNVWRDSSSEADWKRWISQEHKIAVGHAKQSSFGSKFFYEVSIGDIVLVAQGANWQKKFFLAGIIDSNATEEEDDDGRYFQWRKLSPVLDKSELDSLHLEFSEKTTYGSAKQIPALYELKPHIPADNVIITKLKDALLAKELEKNMQKYLDLLEQHKNIVLTGAPGTGKTYLAKKIAEEITQKNSSLQPLEAIRNYYDQNQEKLNKEDAENESRRQRFLEHFPLEKIENITLNEYCLGYEKSENNFCHWIEERLKPLGAFWPVAASTFIVYRPMNQSERYTDNGCDSPEETIKALGKAIKEIGETGYFKAKSIGDTPMRSDYIIKIAVSYNKDLYFPVCSKLHMEQICSIFGIPKDKDVFKMNKNILEHFKKNLPNLPSWIVMDIIYRLFYRDKKWSTALSPEETGTLDVNIKFTQFVQFHPSYDYTDFVEGLRPVQGADGEIKFELKSGIFKALCQQARCFSKAKFVMVIDEINRAELSKVFGELFYSIDPGYRGEEGKTQLQYSNLYNDTAPSGPGADTPFKDGFYVPENVYIIATMNDIDRSIEPFDFAMKRRFAWCEIKADDTCDDMWRNGTLDDATRKQAKDRMISLNKCIEKQFSSAYEVGGAYFLKLKDLKNDFEKLWKYHLKPLIKDYLKGNHDAEAELANFKDAYDLKKEPSDDSPKG